MSQRSIVVPYEGSNILYHEKYDDVNADLYYHPVMAYGETGDGRELGMEEVLNTLNTLTDDDPLFPLTLMGTVPPV